MWVGRFVNRLKHDPISVYQNFVSVMNYSRFGPDDFEALT
jgi:hypothetical protein